MTAQRMGAGTSAERRLVAALACNVAMVVGQLVVASSTRSLGLFADAAHNATDVAALGLAAVAAWLARRPSDRHTFGRGRATVLAAAANGAGLVLLSGVVVVEALRRLADPVGVPGGEVLVTALAAAGVNLLAVWLVGHGADLNSRAALLHLATDVGASLAVALAGLVLLVAPGQTWVDPAISIAVAVVAILGGVRITRQAVAILGDAVPAHLDAGEVATTLAEADGVVAVHHLHLWSTSDRSVALSAHVVVEPGRSLAEAQVVGDGLRRLAAERFGVGETTLQLEASPCDTPDCEPATTAVLPHGHGHDHAGHVH